MTLPTARERALTLWQTYPRELVAAGALTLVVAAGGSAWSTPTFGDISEQRAEHVAPAPPPLLVRNLAPTEATTINQKIALASGPNPAAAPFSAAKAGTPAHAQALECLTQAVYYEAGNESADGQRAVAQVVLNRVRHPAFPSTVCGVVYQGSTRTTGCQFTFTCDGSLMRGPNLVSWKRSREVAEAALGGAVFAPVGLATHYHANYVVPYWASTLAKNAVIGAHLFYRWAGNWGKPPAFTQKYAKQEASAAVLKSTALAAFATRPVKAPTVVEEEVAEVIPGAEAGKAEPGRVVIRFKLEQAREAVEKAVELQTPKPYVEKMAASDNLRWTLSGKGPETAPQTPLGKAPTTAPATPAGD
ncbi:cell wall hydrolase [Sphingomonas sabuli]|uniref:Cell wall hydrolase n=2 Tax=Sphingomonas sabuli TaxID=2764186 RepID=A0A7G9L5N0_9SPHN|nr:cell wall hydrolase [Sphingomonas sabuli]